MLKSVKYLGLILIILNSGACVTAPKPALGKSYKPAKDSITIMTYNVENLFDTDDDPEKNDESFLPAAKKNAKVKAKCRATNTLEWRMNQCMTDDWSESHLERKMSRLTNVLKQVRNGEGPDLLIMEEVENQNVLEMWRKEYLSKFNYKPAILIEGPDERGIDVGMFTRLEIVGEPKLHEIKFQENAELPADQIRKTRGILELTVKLPDGSLLTAFGVHLPSQGAPTETRRQALAKINELKAALPADRMTIVAGDFNISFEEEEKKAYISGEMAKTWGVSHMIGCEGCQGTYYYRKLDSWSFFDIVLLSPNMLNEGQAAWAVVPESVRIENNSKYQWNRWGSPARFSNTRTVGVSDHWPMVLEIVPRNNKSVVAGEKQ